MHIRFPYGGGAVEANLEWGRCLDVLDVAPTPALPDSAAALREGLKSPHGLS